jgi:hypothetical protein
METKSKKGKSKNVEMSEIKHQREELLQLLLEKTGLTYNDLIEHAKADYIVNNLDVLTPSETQQFTKLIF